MWPQKRPALLPLPQWDLRTMMYAFYSIDLLAISLKLVGCFLLPTANFPQQEGPDEIVSLDYLGRYSQNFFLPFHSLLPVTGLFIPHGVMTCCTLHGGDTLAQRLSGRWWELWAHGYSTDTEEQSGLTETTCHKMSSLIRTYGFYKLNSICNVRDLKITIALNTVKITEELCPL